MAAVATASVAALSWVPVPLRGSTPDASDGIRSAVDGRAELIELYGPVGFTPIWTDGSGTLRDSALDAVRLLESSAADGLEPADYGLVELRAMLATRTSRRVPPELIAPLDVALSERLLRYLQDLHFGRIDPRAVGFLLNVPRDGHDFPTLLRDAVAARRLVDVAHAWAPRGPEYPALVVALARYREMASRERHDLPRFSRSVHPGERWDGAPALHARLVLLGDLPGGMPVQALEVYDGPLVEGVRRFQRRHGLEPDGVLGAKTMTQLAVPLAWRVRQLELAMERLRWLPHRSEERLIVVNIPMFRLFAWDTIPPAGAPSFSTRVVVGRAFGGRTPVFSAALTEIVFRPYWNVPGSIVRKEILPKLARDPGYLDREQMEVVDGQRDDSPVVAATAENLLQARKGLLRIRQRPGPKNALGLIKFSFPNEHDVYMHGTPAQALFARSRRDFSHGCVRVEDPVGLAEWVLGAQPGWDRERILGAKDAAESSRVPVKVPLRVILLYSTAAVLLESGEVAFADDIYQHDQSLDLALKRRASGYQVRTRPVSTCTKSEAG